MSQSSVSGRFFAGGEDAADDEPAFHDEPAPQSSLSEPPAPRTQEQEARRPKPVPGKESSLQVDPTLPLRLAQERLRTERVFAELGQHNRSAGGEAWDLCEAGLSSIASIVKVLAILP